MNLKGCTKQDSFLFLPDDELFQINKRFHAGETLGNLAQEFDFSLPEDAVWPYGRETKPRKSSLERAISRFLETARVLPESKHRNADVKNNYFCAYIRSRKTKDLHLLDIARIEVTFEYRYKRVFSTLVSSLDELKNAYDGVRIEQIFNPLLTDWCARKNWQTEYRNAYAATYFIKFDSKAWKTMSQIESF